MWILRSSFDRIGLYLISGSAVEDWDVNHFVVASEVSVGMEKTEEIGLLAEMAEKSSDPSNMSMVKQNSFFHWIHLLNWFAVLDFLSSSLYCLEVYHNREEASRSQPFDLSCCYSRNWFVPTGFCLSMLVANVWSTQFASSNLRWSQNSCNYWNEQGRQHYLDW